MSWGILGGVIAVLLLPGMASLLKTAGPFHVRESAGAKTVRGNPLLRDWRFYLLLPGFLFLPLVLTALFLYQIPLAQFNGWSMETMATAFIGFAAARMVSSLIAGQLIDRWGAVRLFPVILFPVTIGLALLSAGAWPWIAFAYLILAGISQGMAGPTMTALWAEIYGVESLGRVKGTVSTLGIFGTAMGPMLLGWMLQAGISFSTIIPGCVAGAVLILALNVVMSRVLSRSQPVANFQ